MSQEQEAPERPQGEAALVERVELDLPEQRRLGPVARRRHVAHQGEPLDEHRRGHVAGAAQHVAELRDLVGGLPVHRELHGLHVLEGGPQRLHHEEVGGQVAGEVRDQGRLQIQGQRLEAHRGDQLVVDQRHARQVPRSQRQRREAPSRVRWSSLAASGPEGVRRFPERLKCARLADFRQLMVPRKMFHSNNLSPGIPLA